MNWLGGVSFVEHLVEMIFFFWIFFGFFIVGLNVYNINSYLAPTRLLMSLVGDLAQFKPRKVAKSLLIPTIY